MKIELVRQHLKDYLQHAHDDQERHQRDHAERQERIEYYRSWSAERIRNMTEEDLYDYMSKLWAMLIWGNKHYKVKKLIEENGMPTLQEELAELVWGKAQIEGRWDRFRSKIKGMGPATISEILCHVHPNDCMLWNRRAYVGFRYLGVENLPRHDYQLTGKRYRGLSDTAKEIADEMRTIGIRDANLLTVDYFIWDELQFEENLSQIHKKTKVPAGGPEIERTDKVTSDFIHNEVCDKLSDIGLWLGFVSNREVKVADGSKVDTVWEATIGNMGRVIYVFEVQTKGSIDSLIINLLKALNNPAVQGVVAVSDASQIETIKKHAAGVSGLRDKLKCWDYKQVLQVHEALESVNEAINSLGLVPQGF